MTQCPGCHKQKKADNCIQCYADMKARYLLLIDGIEEIVRTCSHIRAGEIILARLAREREKLE